ncbi:SIMPL domain-containing protein [Microbulbifer spongiae]|uniref:SIMPL domain-containing protein n=1 Tax=Microbulbifer spongiae TaxID=2944933 RepID=A0ABY9EAB3_9GAMM|nr:SIMPL domain-containing protein [Microbulbifer sp. MI-G]WKD48449.1 SIMPL domain-containing protein [Microbulbifer sp. MI-G]
MNNNNQAGILFAAFLLATGIAAAGHFVSQTLYKSKVALNTAEVKGLAERRVEADTAYWSIQYTVTGKSKSEIPALYKDSEADQNKIISLLKSSGFTDHEIQPGIINYLKKEFRDEDQKLVEEEHILVGEITVETQKVRLVSEVRSNLNTLIAQGLDIKNNPPAYHFTQLNKIKPAMLKEATTNARIAANEFAINAGVEVGGIRSARQGGFVIRDVGENYGDTRKIEKEVRVVTNVTFFLTD